MNDHWHMMNKNSIEQQGLLQPESFDLDNFDSVEQRRETTRTRRRYARPRFIIIALATLSILLVIGTVWNKGAAFRLPKLHKTPPSSPPTEDAYVPQDPPKEPHHPQTPSAPDHPPPSSTTSYDLPERPASPWDSGVTASANVSATTNIPALTSETPPESTSSPTSGWIKPADFKIIGLVFFGRPPVVAILDCYLKKNIVTNGGWLDEVHFVVNTDREADIAYLDELVENEELYKKIDLNKHGSQQAGYQQIWKTVEKQHMYIKIDDDIVYFNDEAIQDLVWSKIHHPNALNVVANLINSPETGWIHYRIGAIHSYLPEVKAATQPDPKSSGPTAWRASELPEWTGKKMEWPIAGINAGKIDDGTALPSDVPGAPPYKGHRWLPLPDSDQNLDKTPMWESSYDPNGPDWGSWSLGAQAHYSFLENLEKDQLNLYHYGHGLDENHEAIWNMMYARMNINFMAIWGKDVLSNLPFDDYDDEKALSMTITKKLKRPLLINTHAIAAHFSFRSQIEMYDTDLLDRYRAYANENVCAKDNQIPYQKVTT